MTSTCVTHTFQQQMWIASVRGSPSKNATSCASAKHLSESLYLVLQAALNFETAEEKYAAGHGSVTPLCRLQTRRGASIENIEACGMALHAKLHESDYTLLTILATCYDRFPPALHVHMLRQVSCR